LDQRNHHVRENIIIKIALQILTVAIFVGGVLYSLELEVALGIIALLFLVTAQILFLVARTKVTRNAPPIDSKHIADIINKIKKSPTIQEPTPEPFEPTEEKISSDIFSKFQQNLDQSTPRAPIKAKAPEEENEVIVSLSSKRPIVPKKAATLEPALPRREAPKQAVPAYNPYSKVSKPALKPAPVAKAPIDDIDVGSIDSLFDDIQEPSQPKPKRPPVTPSQRKQLKEVQEAGAAPELNSPVPLISKEILTSEDFEVNPLNEKKETEMVLSLVKKSLKAENYQEGLKTIQQWLQTSARNNAPAEQIREVLQLKGDCEFALQLFEEASKSWQILAKKYFKGGDASSLKLLEDWNRKFIDLGQQKFALHFLFTSLNEYRHRDNYTEMDQTYLQIETGYEQLKDWARLIQTIQNHMAIKKIIKDYAGQLSLLDHLGKLLYDQGDADGSRKCYEQSIAIKQQMLRG